MKLTLEKTQQASWDALLALVETCFSSYKKVGGPSHQQRGCSVLP